MLLLPLGGCYRADMRKPLIAILIPSQDNPFFKAEADAAADRARALGYRVRIDAHDDDAYRQDNLIDSAIASNAAAIILDNAGTDASIAAIRRATRAGIPCFLIDREIDGGRHRQGADHWRTTIRARSSLRPRLRRRWGVRPAAYAELLGRESDTNAQVRTRGFHAVARSPTGSEACDGAVRELVAGGGIFKRRRRCCRLTRRSQGIIAGNDTMALGAIAAVKSSHLQGILIAGFDGSPDAVAAIRAGEMESTALQPAVKIARLAVDEADRFLKTGTTGAAGAAGHPLRPRRQNQRRRLQQL